MDHTLENLIFLTPSTIEREKQRNIQALHFDYSGHVVATNGHRLLASKRPFNLKHSGKTFSTSKLLEGQYTHPKHGFPDWKLAIPNEAARKVQMKIPKWFKFFKDSNETIALVLDYTQPHSTHFKISNSTNETSLALDAKYLWQFADTEVSLLIYSPNSAVVILPTESKIDPQSPTLRDDLLTEEWFYLLMPLKLDREKTRWVHV